MEQKKRGNGCLIAAVAVGIALVIGFAAVVAAVTVGISRGKALFPEMAGSDEYPALNRVWSYGKGDVQVVRIAVSGVIASGAEEGFFGPGQDPVQTVLTCIQDATVDESVVGIILEINSPGGEITASDVIYKALLDFKEAQPGRVVVALLGDVAASGGYYVALAADYIMAHPTTLTGSIGVLISSINVKGLGDKLGVKDMTIKSGENKDLLNPLREPTAEEKAILQNVIDELYARFVGLVMKSRDLTEETVHTLADGRVFSAGQALEVDLIDEIGYWDDAVAKMAELLDVEDVKVMRYEQRLSLAALLMASADRMPVAQLRDLIAFPRTRIMYLWQP